MRCCAIDGAPLSISGYPGWVTVVGDVGFEMLHTSITSTKEEGTKRRKGVCVFGEGMW